MQVGKDYYPLLAPTEKPLDDRFYKMTCFYCQKHYAVKQTSLKIETLENSFYFPETEALKCSVVCPNCKKLFWAFNPTEIDIFNTAVGLKVE